MTDVFEYKKVNKIKIKKKHAIALGVVALIAVASILGIFVFSGMVNFGEEITFDAEEGDKYYLSLADSYYDDRDEETIRNFKSILKSEILRVKDLELDADDEDDLTIMSSWSYGKEDTFSLEIPNYFDIYQLLLGLDTLQRTGVIDFEEMDWEGNSSTSYLNETQEIMGWGFPSAIHYQSSGIYHEIQNLIDMYDLGQFSDMEFPAFNHIAELLEFVYNNIKALDPYNETFEEYETFGDTPFVLNTEDTENNSAEISEVDDGGGMIVMTSDTQYDNKLNLTQLGGQTDDMEVELDLFKEYLQNEEIADRVNLSDYIYNPKRMEFDLDLGNLEHNFVFGLNSDQFNITETVKGVQYNFNGYNGLQFRITNESKLEAHYGDWFFDGKWKETEETQKGWYEVADLSPFGTDLKIEISDITEKESEIKIIGDSSSSMFFIQNHIDCPFDFLEAYDNNNGETTLFRMSNISSLYFGIENSSSDTSTLIDNILLDGNVIWQFNSFDELVGDFWISQIMLLSFYHFLFYPNELDLSIISSIANVINEMATLFFDLEEDFLIVDEDDSGLKLEIPYETFDSLREIIDSLLLEDLNLQIEGFVSGETDIMFEIVFDKRINALYKSLITIKYKEIDITRTMGIKLLAVSNGNGEAKYKDLTDGSTMGLPENYPSQPKHELDTLLNEVTTTMIIGYIATAGISIGATIGILKLIDYLKKKKKLKR
jgi:hypothetical protein